MADVFVFYGNLEMVIDGTGKTGNTFAPEFASFQFGFESFHSFITPITLLV